MAHSGGVRHFRSYIDNFIKENQCYGFSSVEPSIGFVPRLAIENYWHRDRIINVLCAGSKRIPADPDTICKDYLVVFSILVWNDRPEAITTFTEIGLDDHHIPVTSKPRDWLDVAGSQSVWDDLQKGQWRFCPLNLGQSRLHKAKLDPNHIVPIAKKEWLGSSDNSDDSDDSDDVRVYKASWHPLCQPDENCIQECVLKEFRERGPRSGVTDMFNNEVDVYSNLNPAETGYENVVRYLGSFTQQGKSTIILESANDGDLQSFFKSDGRPYRHLDRLEFWASFFRLLLGLHATHNLNAIQEPPENQWLLKGIHQDIRPQNILSHRLSTTSRYQVRFMLTDFGTGHVRKCRARGLDSFAQQHVGNGMYSAPESYRDDRVPKPQMCEGDIWSLGAVASEALVWTIQGERKRLEYQDRRSAATGKTDLAGGNHEGSFHDRYCRLKVVDETHADLLKSLPEGDTVSPLVSRIILEHMLVANAHDRSNAWKTFQAWSDGLSRIRWEDNVPPTAFGSSHVFASPRTATPNRQSSNSTTFQAETRASRDRMNWIHDQLHTSEPASMEMEPSHSTPTAVSPSQSHGLRHRQSWDNYERPGTNNSEISGTDVHRHGSTRTRRPWGDTFAIMAPNWEEERLGIRSPSPSIRPVPPYTAERQSQVGVSTPTSAEVAASPPDREPESPPSRPSHGDTTPTYHQSTSSVSQRTSSFVTIDEIYSRCIKPRDKSKKKFFGLRAVGDHNPLESYQQIKEALGKLKATTGETRDQLGKTVRVLAKLLKAGHVDPDNIDLYYTCTREKVSGRQSTNLQDHVDKHVFDAGPCDIFSSLDAIATQILKPGRRVSVYILTNGRWNAKSPTDLCRVDQVIKRILLTIDQRHKASDHVGIQFIRFYRGAGDSREEEDKRRLQYLDDNLKDHFRGLDVAKRDIVDMTDWDGDVCKMLLGGVFEDVDGLSPSAEDNG